MRFGIAAVILASVSLAEPAHGVILYKSATRNTTAPTGALLNSGWQYQGQYHAFLGTPIGSQYFITAQHIGGGAGIPFIYNGVSYSIDATFGASVGHTGWVDQAGTDLRIWKINQNFPNWAPLYDESIDGSLIGKPLTVFGRGTQRGVPVYAESISDDRGTGKPGQLKGWQWGPADSVQSWGTNVVSFKYTDQNYGPLVGFDFDANGSSDEGQLSSGDSGGGMFVQSGGVWKLAGINLAVDSPWRVSQDAAAFDAAIFDYGGLYYDGPPLQYFPDQANDLPSSAYCSAISDNLSFIRSYVPGTFAEIPEPAAGALALAAAGMLRRKRR